MLQSLSQHNSIVNLYSSEQIIYGMFNLGLCNVYTYTTHTHTYQLRLIMMVFWNRQIQNQLVKTLSLNYTH